MTWFVNEVSNASDIALSVCQSLFSETAITIVQLIFHHGLSMVYQAISKYPIQSFQKL